MDVSTREVADALNLPVDVIDALEADDYERLQPSVFTRGYLRSYARLLELPPESLLARYPEVTEEVDAITAELPVAEVPSSTPGRTLGIAAAVGVVLLALLVWLLGDDETPVDAPEQIVEAPEPATEPAQQAITTEAPTQLDDEAPREVVEVDTDPIATEPTRTDQVETRQVETDPQPLVQAEPDDSAPEPRAVAEQVAEQVPDQVAEPVSGESETAARDPVGEPAREPAAEVSTTTADVQDVAGTTTSAVPESAAESTPAAEAAARPAGPVTPSFRERRITEFGDDAVTFVFSDDCWVEVKSLDGENLYSDLNRAGRTLVLNGRAPFRILLGYAPGVTLSFNGEPVPLERYSRNNVANLVLGE